MWLVVMPLCVRPCGTRVYPVDVLAKDGSSLPSVATARQCVVSSCWVAVLTNVLGEEGEDIEELHYTVVTQNPLTAALASRQDTNVVIESTVVAERVKGEHPTMVGVVGLLGTQETATTG